MYWFLKHAEKFAVQYAEGKSSFHVCTFFSYRILGLVGCFPAAVDTSVDFKHKPEAFP